jgi:phage portal protein BeeE
MMDSHPEVDPENNQYSESTQRMSAVLRTRDKYDVEAYTTEIREQVGDGLQNVQSSR